jgi:predicted nucleic acid-binding protein
MRGLLDASVFGVDEQSRALPATTAEESAISLVTLSELEPGRTSRDERGRPGAAPSHPAVGADGVRGANRSTSLSLSAFAGLVSVARRAGRRPKARDAWIVATARAHRVSVYSLDADFDELPVDVVRV